MREFSNNIAEELINGLASNERAIRNNQFVQGAENMWFSQNGARYPLVPNAIESGFPFPQIFNGGSQTLICYSNRIEVLNDNLTRTRLLILDDDGVPDDIDIGSDWHFADLGESWYLFNGVNVVYFSPSIMEKGTAQVEKEVHINTGTFNGSRMICGGFSKDKPWNLHWKQAFLEWIKGIDEPFPILDQDLEGNSILWSSIGGGDYPMWLFKPALAFTGITQQTPSFSELKDSLLYDSLLRNEWGIMQMPFRGEVMAIKTLGTGAVVYGTDGVVALTNFSSADAQIATFAQRRLLRLGIAERGHVGGDENGHVFIATDGKAYRIAADFSITRLGYDNHLGSLVSKDTRISVDSLEGLFYIGTESGSFILDQQSLGQTRDSIASIAIIDGESYSIKEDGLGGSLLITSKQDFGLRAIKTVTSIQIASTFTGDAEVAVDFRYNNVDQFTRTEFVPLNKEGDAVLRISGTDFRIIIKTESDDFTIDYIQVKWQASDKRQIRGTFVSPSAS